MFFSNYCGREASDEEPVNCARKDPSRGFETLVEKYWSIVKAFLKYIGAKEPEVEDLTQETFVKVHCNLDKFDFKRPLTPWILTIARHVLYDRNREKSRIKRTELPPDRTSPSPLLEDQVINRLTAEEFLSQLSDDDKLLIELRIFLDLSFQEISELTGDTPNSLRVKLHRILKSYRPAEVEENLK